MFWQTPRVTVEARGIPAARAVRHVLPSLTGLRIFAAGLVVCVHASYLLPNPVTDFFRFGMSGVTFFFVLSGFILAWTASPNHEARAFYRRRFARVVPLHWLMWLIALAVVPVIRVATSSGDAVLGFFLVQAWFPDPAAHFGGNIVAWTLSCEVVFYAMFPLLIRTVPQLSTRRLAFVAASMAAVSVTLPVVLLLAMEQSSLQGWLYYIFPLARLPEFVLGVALAILMLRGWRVRVPVVAALALVVAVLVASTWLPVQLVPVAAPLVPLALLIVAAASSDLAGRATIWRHPWVLRLGQWSFALYLIHWVVIQAFIHYAHGRLERAVAVPVAVALSVALSAAAFTWYERPVERRLRGQ